MHGQYPKVVFCKIAIRRSVGYNYRNLEMAVMVVPFMQDFQRFSNYFQHDFRKITFKTSINAAFFDTQQQTVKQFSPRGRASGFFFSVLFCFVLFCLFVGPRVFNKDLSFLGAKTFNKFEKKFSDRELIKFYGAA